ncbi:MAG TPA: muraminidase [Erwinia sp.]|uniref:lysozyme n=1 Tax=Erwinia citreus TaxID=558 RepID=UPI000E8DE6CB|nr:lysozyme [Erwinia sp.]HBV38169.1 muraminidase [Erwinia sp.]
MKISEKGIRFIKEEEGEKLTGYLDCVGIPTIGVGHTGNVDGVAISKAMIISAEKSTELLHKDLAVVEQAIANAVTVPLSHHQYDALCSLIFNIGVTAFVHSTVRKKLNERKYQEAADAFLLWKRAGKKVNLLLPRRKREYALFLTPDGQR